jgi:hypothetical protein
MEGSGIFERLMRAEASDEMVECPWCGVKQEGMGDDGVGCHEDIVDEKYCDSCDKDFLMTTTIRYSYQGYKDEEDMKGG